MKTGGQTQQMLREASHGSGMPFPRCDEGRRRPKASWAVGGELSALPNSPGWRHIPPRRTAVAERFPSVYWETAREQENEPGKAFESRARRGEDIWLMSSFSKPTD